MNQLRNGDGNGIVGRAASLKAITQKLIDGCIVKADRGVNMYTPDGMGNYAALWTRDFAYMVEHAGDLMEEADVQRAIEYLMSGADTNGWIPDRVERDGTPRYTAGGADFPALPNLDNGCFLVMAADAFLDTLPAERAVALFSAWQEVLVRGIACLPKDDKGMICNESTPLHSPYGFTDTVAKGGTLCFETLLLWKAEKALVKWLEKTGVAAEEHKHNIVRIEKYFTAVFMDESGMLLAATEQCRQIDVWASCFAVSVDFPLTATEKDNISTWLIKHYDSIVEAGQIRHLPRGEYWEKLFVPVDGGTYQNGAFWATPTGWFVDAIIEKDNALAMKTLTDVLTDFEDNGVFECINGDYRKLDTYVASATNVYGACKKYGFV